jgi:hypothetical protein
MVYQNIVSLSEFVSDERLPEVWWFPDASLSSLQRQQEVSPQERPPRELRRIEVKKNTF